jgi:hypothetical protein
LGGGGIALALVRRRNRPAREAAPLTAAERDRLAALLDGQGADSGPGEGGPS